MGSLKTNIIIIIIIIRRRRRRRRRRRIIRSIGDDVEGYKYLGVLEADDIMQVEVKRSMKKEYIRRVKKTLSSKLNAGNIIKAINSWAVSLLRYSGRIVNWTKSELAELDRRTRKLLTIHGALHPRSNVSRLYLPRREGGRGLISVEDAINIEERNINVYVCQSQERLLKTAWKRKNVNDGMMVWKAATWAVQERDRGLVN